MCNVMSVLFLFFLQYVNALKKVHKKCMVFQNDFLFLLCNENEHKQIMVVELSYLSK